MAVKVIQNIAKFNKRKLPEGIAMELLSESNRKSKKETAEVDKTRYSVIDLFRSKSIAKITLLLILGWYVKTWVHVGSVIFRKYQNIIIEFDQEKSYYQSDLLFLRTR